MIENLQQRSIHRAKILQGQLKALQTMIENEDYCVDILTQSLAIQKSLASLNKLILQNHLQTHITDMMQAGGEQAETAVQELLKLYELINVRGRQ